MPDADSTAVSPPAATLPPGARVLVEFRTGWLTGTFLGCRAGFEDEDFQRLDVALDDGRTFPGAHPDCVTEAVARG